MIDASSLFSDNPHVHNKQYQSLSAYTSSYKHGSEECLNSIFTFYNKKGEDKSSVVFKNPNKISSKIRNCSNKYSRLNDLVSLQYHSERNMFKQRNYAYLEWSYKYNENISYNQSYYIEMLNIILSYMNNTKPDLEHISHLYNTYIRKIEHVLKYSDYLNMYLAALKYGNMAGYHWLEGHIQYSWHDIVKRCEQDTYRIGYLSLFMNIVSSGKKESFQWILNTPSMYSIFINFITKEEKNSGYIVQIPIMGQKHPGIKLIIVSLTHGNLHVVQWLYQHFFLLFDRIDWNIIVHCIHCILNKLNGNGGQCGCDDSNTNNTYIQTLDWIMHTLLSNNKVIQVYQSICNPNVIYPMCMVEWFSQRYLGLTKEEIWNSDGGDKMNDILKNWTIDITSVIKDSANLNILQ